MKKFFVKIRDWISGVWYATRHARQVTDAMLRKSAEPPVPADHELPAELLESLGQLRTKDATVKGRTGQAVTLWIPTETLAKLRANPTKQNLFIDNVANKLVRRALYGLWQTSEGTVEFSKV